ncbi:MAG TPA: diguanylate cyclase, partial [Abditibacteriaceae bacterium]|nr:diguanylate cyclase [Abditibacteriaceae bacterium]
MIGSSANAGLILHQMRNSAYDVTAERVDSPETMAAALATGSWDIVISDQDVAAVSASDVLHVLREHQGATPCIVVADSFTDESIAALMGEGARDCVPRNRLACLGSVVGRVLAEAAFLETNAILKATQEAVADGICLVDNNNAVVSFNRHFAAMWGIREDRLEELRETRALLAYVSSLLREPEDFTHQLNAIADRTAADRPPSAQHNELRLRDGRVFSCRVAPAYSPEGRFYGRVWSLSDTTERNLYEQWLLHQAFHDALTDLPNRALFLDRLTRAIARSERSGKTQGVLFIDLDGFKRVNDTLGHDKGDSLLIQIARRLQHCLRPGDTAARFGGDEFTILLEDIQDVADATRVAQRITDALAALFHVDGHDKMIAASIGVSLSTSAQDRAEDLLR